MILHSLNRLRLRLGLFRWRSYAWIDHVCGSAGECYEVHWYHPRTLAIYADSAYLYMEDAIAHIRRCVKKGKR